MCDCMLFLLNEENRGSMGTEGGTCGRTFNLSVGVQKLIYCIVYEILK